MSANDPTQRISSGLAELDEVLAGGFFRGSSYLIRGGPGQGKTTLGLHFLTAGDDDDAKLFIGFQESEAQLRTNAASVGIDVDNTHFLSLAPDEQFFAEAEAYDVFAAADVEAEPLAASVTEAVDKVKPTRVFVDSMTQLRFLSSDLFQYRKQVLSFLRFFRERGATVLFSSERSSELPDEDLQFIADGVITLDSTSNGSTLHVGKFRGSGYQGGHHQVRVGPRGLEVFPRLMPPATQVEECARTQWSSGVDTLDTMLSGGIEAGTITLITGPSGTGKSTLAASFVAEAAERGHGSAIFGFEEEVGNLLARCDQLGIPLRKARVDGLALVEQVEPLRFLGDEFAMRVQRLVKERDLDIVVIDSLAGFELTLGANESSRASLHALAKTLARGGTTVILVNEVEAVTGQFRVSERSISYLADNVVLMRYVEMEGRLQKVVGVLKKRLSSFDRRFLPFQMGPERFTIDTLNDDLHGVLDGQLTAPTGTDD